MRMRRSFEWRRIDGGGNGQLNVYSGGIVSLGANIVGVTAVSLYRTTAQSAYRLELSSTQQNLVVNDVAGGSTVWIKNSSQAVINRGSNVTVAKATADNANAVVRGNASANATLEVTTGGSISLASADNYLTVCLDIPAKLQLNAMQFITADASVGHSTITTVAAKQTVLAGPGDKIFDSMRAGMTLIGDIAHLNGDLIAGYNSRDVVHITDLPYEGTKLSITKGFGRADLTLSHGGTQLHLSVSSMGYSGPGSAFELSSDGGTGSLLTFADPARSIKI